MARYYSEHIIKKLQLVSDVFKLSKLDGQLRSLFPYDRLKELNRKELDTLLAEAGETYDAVLEKLSNIDPSAIYLARVINANSVEERRQLSQEYTSIDSSDPDAPRVSYKNITLLREGYGRDITSLLNDLEWFAMACRYGLADEEMLYQSLHQTYISHVWLLYFYICKSNLANEDKYYTNLIWLFNLWKDRLETLQKVAMKKRDAADKVVAAAEHKRIEAEKEEQLAREAASHIDSDIYTGTPLK